MSHQQYRDYYFNQIGKGAELESIFGPIYKSPNRIQRGSGLGSALSSAFRFLKPLFRSGVSALKESGISAARNAVGDIFAGKNLGDIVRNQSANLINDLSQKAQNKIRKQTGSGGRRFDRMSLQKLHLNKTRNSIGSKISRRQARHTIGGAKKNIRKRPKQFGGGKNKKRKVKKSVKRKTGKKSQAGSGTRKRKNINKKRHTKKKQSNKKLRELDIFS